jgi:hypothetical protein
VLPVRYGLNCYIFCPHRVHLCVPYGSHNKQRLFAPNSINRLVVVIETGGVFPVRYGLNLERDVKSPNSPYV